MKIIYELFLGSVEQLSRQVHQAREALFTTAFNRLYYPTYQQPKLTLDDYYRDLVQKSAIFTVLAVKLQQFQSFAPLPAVFSSFLNRADAIKNDLDLLAPHVKNNEKNTLLTSTKKYVKMLEEMPVTLEKHQQFLAFFLTEALDEYDVKYHKKGLVRELLIQHKLYNPSLPSQGLNFFDLDGESGYEITFELTAWLMQLIPFQNNHLSPQALLSNAEFGAPTTRQAFSALQLACANKEKFAADMVLALNLQLCIANELYATRPTPTMTRPYTNFFVPFALGIGATALLTTSLNML